MSLTSKVVVRAAWLFCVCFRWFSCRRLVCGCLAVDLAVVVSVQLGAGSPVTRAADWQTSNWTVVRSSSGALKRSAPIRSIVRTSTGRLLGTRPAPGSIELWRSDNNGVDWSRMGNIVQNTSLEFGDSTLHVLPSGEILAGYREKHATDGHSIRVSRSVNGGESWSAGGTIHDWAKSDGFVGAPYFHRLSDGTLQVYYDSEPAAPGSSQYIALKTGAFDSGSQQWQWSNQRVVNTAPAGTNFVRDGLASVVSLGPDLDGVGDRVMVVTEAVSVTAGVAHNVIRAFQVQNGGATQADWNTLLDSRVIYRSAALDHAGRRYNAYAPFALRVTDGPVVVGFSTDEALDAINQSADAASAPPDMRHSEIKIIQTTDTFENWSTPFTVFGLNHPNFTGGYNSGDIYNYQFGMFELAPNDLLATVDMFQGRQLVFRPSLGGLTADFTDDGQVDGADFLRWQQGVGLQRQPSMTTGDATGEGTVNGVDLARWKVQFATAGPAQAIGAIVPEPATPWAVLVLAAAFAGCRGREPRFHG